MRLFRRLVLVLMARPIARIFTGADIVGRERLPLKGPAILVANHASHVDTILMLTLYPSRGLDRVRPAAAADYFLRGGLISWLSNTIIGIVPVARDKAGTGVDVLAPVREALKGHRVVFLDVSYDEALARVGTDSGRPVLARPDLPELYAARQQLYREVATVTVSSAGEPGQTREQLIDMLTARVLAALA